MCNAYDVLCSCLVLLFCRTTFHVTVRPVSKVYIARQTSMNACPNRVRMGLRAKIYRTVMPVCVRWDMAERCVKRSYSFVRHFRVRMVVPATTTSVHTHARVSQVIRARCAKLTSTNVLPLRVSTAQHALIT